MEDELKIITCKNHWCFESVIVEADFQGEDECVDCLVNNKSYN